MHCSKKTRELYDVAPEKFSSACYRCLQYLKVQFDPPPLHELYICCYAVQVDDRADRAIMDRIAGMVVDMAVAPTVVEARTTSLPTKPTTNIEGHDNTREGDATKLGSVEEQNCAPICGNQPQICGRKTRSIVSAMEDSKALDANDLVDGVAAENDIIQQKEQTATKMAEKYPNSSQGNSSASSTIGDNACDSGCDSAGEEVPGATQEEQR